VLIGLTWAFFQHLLSGIRHLVMDTGSGVRAPDQQADAL
jgi:succinate dehydrogenase / fumarate reductase cytochrome b subunit